MLTVIRQFTGYMLSVIAILVLGISYPNPASALTAEESRVRTASIVADADAIDSLHQSLLQLAIKPRPNDSADRPDDAVALQSALARLSRPPTPATLTETPRLRIATSDRPMRYDDEALSILASSLIELQAHAPGRTIRADAASVGSLMRTMQRFDMVTDTIASETFTRVVLGLSDITPTLSDNLIAYPKVPKQDLRDRVVAESVPRIVTSIESGSHVNAQRHVPYLAAASITDQQAMPLDDATSDQALGGQLIAPVGELALQDMNAASDSVLSHGISSAEQYADTAGLDLDEIALEDLGSTSIASLNEPVGAEDLQDTRAGFLLNNGVRIDFAVTRFTSVDGIDQLHTIANLPEGLNANALSQISAGQTSNTRMIKPDSGSMFTLIQNDLGNQRIIDVTTIDVGIKNLGLRSIDFVRPSLQRGGIPAELR
jgi:hypothetical protein